MFKKEDFVKQWQFKKQGDVVAAASEMKGTRTQQEDRTIFQKQISEDIFLYAIFDGHEGYHTSSYLQDYFSKLKWDKEFKELLVAYSEQKPEAGKFEETMNEISAKVDGELYYEDSKALGEWVKEWHKGTIVAVAGDVVENLAQCCVYLMLRYPSDKDLLAVLEEYIKYIGKALPKLEDAEKRQQCYRFLLDMKGSYKNLRRISDDQFKEVKKEFRDFCVKACKATDLSEAVAYVNSRAFQKFHFLHPEYARQNEMLKGEFQAAQGKKEEKIIQILKDNNIKFGLQTLKNAKFEKTDRVPMGFAKIRWKRVKKGTNYTGTESFKFSIGKFPDEEPNEIPYGNPSASMEALIAFNKECLELLGEDFVLGNNTSISFHGSTALFAFLNVKNGTIVNVSIGDSLSIVKTTQAATQLNNELDFNNKGEQARATGMDDDFQLTNDGLCLWGESLEPSRAFGDFTYKIISEEISFAKWSKDDYGGKNQKFEELGPITKAEFAVAKLGQDAKAFIMGCDGVWKKNIPGTIANLIDKFYFQKVTLENLQSGEDKWISGKTNPMQGEEANIPTTDRKKCYIGDMNVQIENLKLIKVGDIDYDKRLVLSLAQVQNWSYPSNDNISIICVDLRLLVQKLGVETGFFGTEKVQKDECENKLEGLKVKYGLISTGEKAPDDDENFTVWLGAGEPQPLEKYQEESEKTQLDVSPMEAKSTCDGEKGVVTINAHEGKTYTLKIDQELAKAFKESAEGELSGVGFAPLYGAKTIVGIGANAVVFKGSLSGEDKKDEEVGVRVVKKDEFDQDAEKLREAQLLDSRFHAETYLIVTGKNEPPPQITLNVNPILCERSLSLLRMESSSIWTNLLKEDSPLRTGQQAIARIMLGTCIGLKTLHDKYLVHRDIKPENILLRKDGDQYVSILCDFGVMISEDEIDDGIGTLPYYSHGLSKIFAAGNVRARTSDDIWALGATFNMILFGETPTITEWDEMSRYGGPRSRNRIYTWEFESYDKVLENFDRIDGVLGRPDENLIKEDNKDLIALIGQMLDKDEDKIINIEKVIEILYGIATMSEDSKQKTTAAYSNPNLVNRKSGPYGMLSKSSIEGQPFNIENFVEACRKTVKLPRERKAPVRKVKNKEEPSKTNEKQVEQHIEDPNGQHIGVPNGQHIGVPNGQHIEDPEDETNKNLKSTKPRSFWSKSIVTILSIILILTLIILAKFVF